MDGKENRLLKELTTAKGDEGGQELSLGSRRRRAGVFVMDFISLESTQNISLFSFWNTEEGKRICVVTDRRIRDWFCF